MLMQFENSGTQMSSILKWLFPRDLQVLSLVSLFVQQRAQKSKELNSEALKMSRINDIAGIEIV